VTLAAATWLQRKRGLPVGPWWPAATLAWVCLQGAFGALTVTMKLFPAIVTLHLLGGMVLLALLCRQAVAYEHAQRGRAPVPRAAAARGWLFAGAALLWVQIALGGWVSTNYAVLACSDFPSCQGSWWPEMDLRQGFELWRELGMTGGGEHLNFAALTGIHYAHRLFAVAALATLGFAAWRLRREGVLHRQARWIAALAAWQLATGLSNIVLGWPLLAAVAHTGGAAALVTVLTWALCESRAVPRASPQPSPLPGGKGAKP
jgi:cytochrome c oxidase assembly protein subunit 15